MLKEDLVKPHEKMSALIALQEIKEQITGLAAKICKTDGSADCGVQFNADLFVRCIIGAQYKDKPTDKQKSQEISFKNAIISLLNSDIIDVDKLDYILRDSYMTGYKNANIDIERLIKSFTIVLEDDKWCRLAYKKNALSVIENVILANDSSRRWVQNHPIILYDTYITQRCVSETFQILQTEEAAGENIFEKFFSIDALTEKGIEWSDTERIFLVCDLDVITLFKKAYVISIQRGMEDAEAIFKEYFSRDARRHPLWKSEMEFRVCFNEQLMNEDEQDRMKIITDAVVAIDGCKNKTTSISESIINESMYKKINDGIMDFPQIGRKLVDALKIYFNRNYFDLDMVIIYTQSFESKLAKLNKKSVRVKMPDYALDRWKKPPLYSYSELVDIQNRPKRQPLFYMYSKHKIDIKNFVTYLLTEAEL